MNRKIIKVLSLTIVTLTIFALTILIYGPSTVKAVTNSTFSGVLTDQNNNPVPNAGITLANGPNGSLSGTTDINGAFNIVAAPGTYNLWVTGDNIIGNMTLGGNYTTDVIDLTNDINQNLQLNVATIHVTVRDADGNPVPNIRVRANGVGSTTYFPGYGTEIQATSVDTTNANGEIDLITLVGQTYWQSPSLATNICALTTPFVCMSSPLTIIGNTAVTLTQPLTAPSNLTALSPTHNPVLNWSAVNGVSYYNVYRNDNQSNTKIGSTSSTSFTDLGVSDGAYHYYVTAVNSIQESAASNLTSVTVDNTNPAITYTLSPSPSAYGWNNSNVTVTFNCTDSGSGISACSNPAIFSIEGANQSVIGNATDNTGNTSSVSATVNIDKTSPIESNLSLSIPRKSATLMVSVSTSDSLSGVAGGEFYIDTDPGIGNGIGMTYLNGQASGQSSTANLANGRHTIYVRVKDKAGNWSSIISGTIRV